MTYWQYLIKEERKNFIFFYIFFNIFQLLKTFFTIQSFFITIFTQALDLHLSLVYDYLTFFILIASLAEMGMKFSFEFKMSLTLLCITSVLHFEPNDKVYLGSSSHVLLWSEFKSYTFKAENAKFWPSLMHVWKLKVCVNLVVL